ncbi:uncharacterized protein FN964_001855 [Alca torda]
MVRLPSSCADFSEEEEEVAKLGVHVFDCQANAECRRTYPSTPDAEGQEELQEQPDKLLQPRLETLITSREHQVAQLMENIAQWMGNASSRGAAGLQEGHRVFLSDLHHTQERARGIYSQLGEKVANPIPSSFCIWTPLGAASPAHPDTVFIFSICQSPSAISTCVLHGSYLVLLVALLVLMPPRAMLLLLAFSILGEFLGIPALSTLLALAVAGQLLVVAARRGAGGPWLVLPQDEPRHQLTSTPERECKMELLQEELDRLEMSCLQEGLVPQSLWGHDTQGGLLGGRDVLQGWMAKAPILYDQHVPTGHRTCPAGQEGHQGWRMPCLNPFFPNQAMLEPAMGTGKHWEPRPCIPSQSLASDMSSLSPRLPCQGLTRAGQRCRKKAILGQDFCHIHTTSRASSRGLPMDSSPHI